ncbi:hypothetical protein [Kitasatospora kifunensis]|uniref:Uncharacterized protein n=1 Tax=Kitasatospora kifunensis TaxID=58351 RepID=A0A7W7QWW6_KITKI|nr:hypothetical protein [Kitasatospora kifunensis]MBB4921230.1 hypothetical protein [Kitasatospora kifunensis]
MVVLRSCGVVGQADQLGNGERLGGEAVPGGDAIAADAPGVRELLQCRERGGENPVELLAVMAGPLGSVEG